MSFTSIKHVYSVIKFLLLGGRPSFLSPLHILDDIHSYALYDIPVLIHLHNIYIPHLLLHLFLLLFSVRPYHINCSVKTSYLNFFTNHSLQCNCTFNFLSLRHELSVSFNKKIIKIQKCFKSIKYNYKRTAKIFQR